MTEKIIIERAQALLGQDWVSHLGNTMSSQHRDDIEAEIAAVLERPNSALAYLLKATIDVLEASINRSGHDLPR